MALKLREFIGPDFSTEPFVSAPDAKLAASEKDGTVPEGYHATSIYPEYFRINGSWLAAEESRMDCAAVFENGKIRITEFRNIRKGDAVILGRSENCEEGIFVYPDGFREPSEPKEIFSFRQTRSRETAFSKDYDDFCDLLKHDREHGKIVWVLGPAAAFDASSRTAFGKLIKNGYVHALLAGNALAAHDLEAAYLHTALGQDIYTQKSQPNGHYNHLDTINKACRYGSIRKFIESENISTGIIYNLEKAGIPYVLAGSIRDDGPLPGVISDSRAAQEAMRSQLRGATAVICCATMLHSIAVGNMTPAYRIDRSGRMREVYFYCIDVSEFAANKLTDRGSLAARSIITNVQDFIVKTAAGLGL